jgi:2-polyprenyl-3-methyl-5-hydroxy-6-metoxy-1,4-benzoquinol methylase
MRRKIYDPLTDRLLYVDREANEQFWDEQWEKVAKATFSNPPRHRATINITRRYLSLKSRIMEGGCGQGDVVYALHNAGFSAEGIDYAPNVVSAINSHWPHLNVTKGDVRRIPCGDGHYDGYWSFGVIEHFAEGYYSIAREMQRCLRRGGYLFLSFPAFNRFRRARAATGKYAINSADPAGISDFYQFALDPANVQADFERLGFELVEHRGTSSLLCIAEDYILVGAIQRFLNFFPSRVNTAVSMGMDLFIGRYAGHSSLLIFRKK